MAESVLIVDPDPEVAKILYKVMRSNQLEADIVGSGEEAVHAFSKLDYSLVITELELPEMDGFALIRALRNRSSKLPILVLSVRAEDYDVLYAIDVGADDYVIKPFNPVTLGAKVKAMLRRFRGNLAEKDNVISVGPFLYNASTLRLYKAGVEIVLTGKENALMKMLLDNPEHIFTKEEMFRAVWGEDNCSGDNTIMVYVNRLRQKVEDDPTTPRYIQTIRGVGYRFMA